MRAESLALILALQAIASTYGTDLTEKRPAKPEPDEPVNREAFQRPQSGGRAQDEPFRQNLDDRPSSRAR